MSTDNRRTSRPDLNAVAVSFKSLHIPGTPVFLANVYDATSALIVASHPSCHALATASYAVALASGTTDDKLDLEEHLSLLAPIASIAQKAGKPLTIDMQSGYGDRLEDTVGSAIVKLGAVGINLEDSAHDTAEMLEVDDACDRILRAKRAAEVKGVPDFVVNARADSFFRGGTLDESIARGKKYLEAGATTVYILWPPGGQMKENEVEKVVRELEGKVNLAPRFINPAGGEIEGGLTAADLARLGVSRVSVGPQLYFAASKALRETADRVFGSV